MTTEAETLGAGGAGHVVFRAAWKRVATGDGVVGTIRGTSDDAEGR